MKKNKLLMTAIAILSFVTITMAQLPSYLPTNGLVGWWPFNGNANDESTNTNDGTVNGATLTPDRFGNSNSAYSFNGVSSASVSGNNINVTNIFFDTGLNAFTISTWSNSNIQDNTSNGGAVQDILSTNNAPGLGIACNWGSSNKYSIWAMSNPPASWDILYNKSSISNFVINQWKHVVMVKNNMDYSIYIDGILDTTFTTTITAQSYLTGLKFGTYWTGEEAFNGKLDDFGIWNRALTPCEIQALYQSGTSSMTVNATSSTICSGLSTTLTASGATTYSWMPGSLSGNSVVVTPSTTTTYTITGTDGSGCTSSTTTSVNVSIPPSAAPSQTNISCNGGSNGSTTIAVSGGAPGYSYLWNNGQTSATLSGLTAGTYTCTVTDANSCSTITAVTLSEPAAIAGIQSPAICVGDNYPVGSSTYTAAGTYTDILTATNGCDSTVTTNLTVNPLPSLAVAATDTNVCVYSSAVSLIAIPAGGTWSGAGIIGSTFSPAIAGAGTTIITYAYSDGNACSNTANIAMLIDLCTGINKFKNNTSFTVYPNPVSDELIIEFQGNKNNTGFEIVNPIGQVIFNGNLLEKTLVQTSNFAPGVYLIKLKNGKSYEFKKIIKE